MKYSSLIIVVSLLANCNNNINPKLRFSKYFSGEKCLIISCIRCGCIIDEINKIQIENSKILTEYPIFIDSNCSKELNPAIKFTHLSQRSIDSLSTDIYNAAILHKQYDGTYSSEIIKTENSETLSEILIEKNK